VTNLEARSLKVVRAEVTLVRLAVCVVRLADMAPVAMEMFSHLILFLKNVYEFSAFNEICKNNAAINELLFKHNKGSFPLTLTGHDDSLYVLIHN
jgi:hypothetical protein